MSDRRVLVSLALVAATLVVYAQALGFDFVRFDDTTYVVQNPQVLQGVTWESLRWAFTGPHSWNWHPVTSTSHLLDVQLFGTDPAGHHATSVALHALNALLLLHVLAALTRRFWPSALVAALFALHPLHVESVAWISERKDVLSLLFMLLTLRAYLAYARHGGLPRYLPVAALFALALMSKPMVVTLPCVLLLLDFWPLYRTSLFLGPGAAPTSPPPGACPPRPLLFLIAEKLPLLALSALSSAVTLAVQESVIRELTPGQRLENALLSYARYVGKSFWPSDLSVFYPHPYLPGGQPPEAWQLVAAALLLAAITLAVLWSIKRRHPLVGWLWFLGTLVPTLGLVQVGAQAMADRYSYIPQIGLLILVVFTLADLLERYRVRVPHLAQAAIALAALVLLALGAQTRAQAWHWRGSIPLFEHSLRVAPGAPLLHNNLGNTYAAAGRIPEAVEQLSLAVRLKPDYASAHYNLGNALRMSGRPLEAIAHFRRALEIGSGEAEVRLNLGNALAELGRLDEAGAEYRVVLQSMPAEGHFSLGNVARRRGRLDDALEHYRLALAASPEPRLLPSVHNNLGATLLDLRRFDEALAQFRTAVELRPDYEEARFNLRMLEQALGAPR